jgi:hypothetical protein
MERSEADQLIQQLATGFSILEDEYRKLFEQHKALERKLATARDQVRASFHTYHFYFHDEHLLALDL